VKEDNNIPEHLNRLKSYRNRINNFANQSLHMNNNQFKTIISASLPDSYQTFVELYETDVDDKTDSDSDSKRSITADNFISIIFEQYTIRQNWKTNGVNSNGNKGESYMGKNPSSKKSLAAHISDKKEPYCNYCKRVGHWTIDCKKNPAAKAKCYNCRHYGHYSKDCKGKKKEKEKERGGEKREKKEDNGKKGESSNVAQVAFITDNGKYYNFNVDNTNNDERQIWYDWLADNETTSHVCNSKKFFSSYKPLLNVSVTGVGGKVSEIKGTGTVKLITSAMEISVF
jgi:Zinc knuckle